MAFTHLAHQRRRFVALLASLVLLVAVAAVVIAQQTAHGNAALQQLTPHGLEYRAAAAELTPLIEHDPRYLPPRPVPNMLALAVVVRVQQAGTTDLRTGMISGYLYSPPGYVVLFEDGTTEVESPTRVQVLTDANITWPDEARRAGHGISLFFVPPLPGSVSLRQLATAPDTLLWDALVALAVGALWRRRHAITWFDVFLGGYVVLLLLGLGVTSTNLGTLVRHRSSLVPWMAILASPLVAHLVRGRRDRHEDPTLTRGVLR